MERYKYVVFAIIVCAWLLLPVPVPAQWSFEPRGIGGGGALFAPSFSQANGNEFYVAGDMSGLYHTTDYGITYARSHFLSIEAGPDSRVCFTNIANIMYCIDYKNDLAVPVKSTSGGATWNALQGNPDPSEKTYYISCDYANPNRLIIAYEQQVYYSHDGGTSFALLHTAVNPSMGVLVGGSFFNGNQVFIGTSDGLLVSGDGGLTFALLATTGIAAGESILSFAGAKQGGTIRLYCLTADGANVYPGIRGWDYQGLMKGVYSLDAGTTTWIKKMNGINPATDYLMFVAMAENDVNTVYAGGGGVTGEPRIMKTLDGGDTWSHVLNTAGNQNINTGWCGSGGDRSWGYSECVFGLSVSPINANRILFTDYGFVHSSANGGVSWQQSYIKPAGQHAIGTTTPVFSNYLTTGLENTSCWNMLWIDATHLLAGFSDIRGIKSDNAGLAWKMAGNTTLNTTYYYLKNQPTGQLYAATSSVHDLYQTAYLSDSKIDAGDGEIMYSVNNGLSWLLLHDFNHPVVWMARHPTNPARLFASVVHYAGGVGEGGIWTTSNLQNGSTSAWSRLAAPPRTEGHPYTIVVLNDGSLLCSYSARRNSSGAFTPSSGVFIMPPGTTTWADVSDAGMYYYTKDVVVSPHDAGQNTWYACVWDGWGGPSNGPGGLYKTANRGQSWTRIFSSSGRVSSITFSPSNTAEAWLTTERDGLWHSMNMTSAMPSFAQVASYGFRQPERVFYNPYNQNELWITSFGNGLSVASLSPNATAVVYRPPEHKIYPNPANEKLSVCHFTSPLAGVEICSLNGEVIYTFPGTGERMPASPSGCIDINVAALPRGSYVVKAFTTSRKFFSKTIVFF